MIICVTETPEEFGAVTAVIGAGVLNVRSHPDVEEIAKIFTSVHYIRSSLYRDMLDIFIELINMIVSKDDYDDEKSWSEALTNLFNEKIRNSEAFKSTGWDMIKENDVLASFLGFKKQDESDLWLIPRYLYSAIPIGLEVESINGNIIINDGANLSNDTNCGMLAYGIHIKE